jgi:polysaccharide pyruvyl transferase WcaK-like protein
VILLGGPAYARDFWPGVYPLCRDLARLEVPVVPLALGWCGEPARAPERFGFDADSLRALRWIHGRIEQSSCRDDLTREILRRHGISNAVVTGCTVWHDPAELGREFARPERVSRLVFTPGARRVLALQNAALLVRLRRRFPQAEIACVFHRGLDADALTRSSDAFVARGLARLARRLGCRVIDAAFDVEKIRFYRDCDLHVGYRLHAHLAFLSLRKPSLLLQEDGRGVGATQSLGLPDVYARQRGALRRLLARLDAELASRFAGFAPVAARLDAAHARMREFLEALP